MCHRMVALLALLVVLSGCVTETKTVGGDVVESTPQTGPTPVEQIETKVRKRIDHMKYEKGTELLKSMEVIASCKELALRPINEALQTQESGIRANLVYTLSLIGGSQAHAIVARQISDKSPVVRYEAASALLQFQDVSGIPILIGFLEDADRRIRFKSFQALEGFTKQNFGYDFGAPEADRAAAVERWRNWWCERRSQLIYEG
jgi:PBS lyase HEAT-like repeat